MTTVSVWAPLPAVVEVVVGTQRYSMDGGERGWWRADVPLRPGEDYGFSLDGGPVLADPRGGWLPEGVEGPSRALTHKEYAWSDSGWRGVSLPGAVLYELHIGTFTSEGTFDGAIPRLDHLVELGIDAVELMPCNAFPGRWGWGYDGVGWYAVHEPYGGPLALKRFVDACHARGLGVIMDVVYNHLGPAGNTLPQFGPYLTEEHTTPWGAAINLDRPGSDEVRRFILDNANMWLRDYHCDGLRLDAVHALVDERALHILEELRQEVTALGAELGKPLFLIAESDRNDPRLVSSPEAGGLGLDAQWSDDLHHALHALLTGERFGYYADFGSLSTLAKALTGVFVHDGAWSSFRGHTHGRPVPPGIPGSRFVVCLQDHDQIGNRARGDRISEQLSDDALKVGAALLLTSAFTPMLFMGEEWGTRRPWQYFSDHSGTLGEAIRRGRRAEFADHGWDPDGVPDPQSNQTFLDSTLDWSELAQPRSQELLTWYRDLLRLRRAHPDLADGRRDRVEVTFDEEAAWCVIRRGAIAVATNLSEQRQVVPVPGAPEKVLLASGPGFVFSDGKVETDAMSVVIVALAAGG